MIPFLPLPYENSGYGLYLPVVPAYKKMQKYHRCDTIVFGEVLGHEKAFLIQNMCPITEKYMKNEYLDSVANIPVRVDGRLEKALKDKAGKVLALQRKGAKLIFPDVLSIEQELLQ